MADVRALLRNERTARRISHPHATYSTTGTLVCLVCHIQLKSESLWGGHLRSPQHAMRLQRIRDGTLGRPPGAPAPNARIKGEQDAKDMSSESDVRNDKSNGLANGQSRKRKADEDDEDTDSVAKRSKSGRLAEGSSEDIVQDVNLPKPLNVRSSSIGQAMQLPSRLATPMKTPQVEPVPSKAAAVDEDEWAAFEADIAATEAPIAEDAVISALPMSAAELAAKSKEEEIARRKKQLEAETEGDKEDATRKLENEFEEMEELESRIRRLKEKREALRLKGVGTAPVTQAQQVQVEVGKATVTEDGDEEEEDEDEDEDWDGDNGDDDGWDSFRFNV